MFAWEWPAVFGEWLACSHISPCSSLRQAEPRAGLVHPVYYITSTNCTICGLLRSACLFWVFFFFLPLQTLLRSPCFFFFFKKFFSADGSARCFLLKLLHPLVSFLKKSWWRIIYIKKKEKERINFSGGERTEGRGHEPWVRAAL